MVPVLFDVSPVNPPVHPKVEAGLFSENTKKVGPGIKGVRQSLRYGKVLFPTNARLVIMTMI